MDFPANVRLIYYTLEPIPIIGSFSSIQAKVGGMRGNFEEGYSGPESYSLNGTYFNGFYDSTPIQ